MAEVQFAKSFLSTLDRKPIKLSSDFVSDPKKYPSQSPYILPKPSPPFPKRALAATSPTTLTITLKPTKGVPSPLTLTNQDPALVTVLDLKTHFAQHASLDVSKIKILYNKRPTSDLKTVKDLLPSGAKGDVEFSVMVLGGGGSAAAVEEIARAETPGIETPGLAAKGEKMEVDSGPGPLSEAVGKEKEVGVVGRELSGEAFWGDLRDFLVQRLKDEKEGERLVGLFRGAVR
ncbi:hypothetical protein KVT40_002270 [Elsinoe batatas]|uniref:Ubiquitin-like domain-containing protein n=1 Tax=Elsinoe batatas TaxID=2601811 RepID=A0A8K0LA71_9PEZI|nr:hypothetical protein KVT40_002270 [Elsinoe batatas]